MKKQKFTVEEILKYIYSQDSFGDVAFNCNAEQIKKANEPILKTSKEWNSEDIFIVLDPDGWDRSNFKYSWFEELITKNEYDKRFVASTVGDPAEREIDDKT